MGSKLKSWQRRMPKRLKKQNGHPFKAAFPPRRPTSLDVRGTDAGKISFETQAPDPLEP